MDDPYTDLANIAIFHCNTYEDEKFLLTCYLGREPSEKEFAHLTLMKLPAKIWYGLEFLWLAGPEHLAIPNGSLSYRSFGCGVRKPPTKAEFLGYSLELLGEVLDFADSHEYRVAFKALDTAIKSSGTL